jgi:hypothetical protein
MAQKTTCDLCDGTTEETYPLGWGKFTGHFQPNPAEYKTKDLCPFCTQALATAIDTMRAEVVRQRQALVTTGTPPAPAGADALRKMLK